MQYDTRTFERFGMTFRFNLVSETSPAWESKFVTTNGRTVVDWVETGEMHTATYTGHVTIQDAGLCKEPKGIEVFSTADGPILGIVYERGLEDITLLDPCIVQFNKGRIDLLPIFNVGRKLCLSRLAIRSIQAPAEVLLAAYPGFLINNRMSKYQLKESVPMASTPELTNDGA
jgi:hypothetical protein